MEGIKTRISVANQNYCGSKFYAKADGQEIEYSIAEVAVPEGYSSELSGSVEAGFVVTNTHTPATITISGAKVWNLNGQEQPDKIVVNLLADDTKVDSKQVDAGVDGSWSFDFRDQPVYKNGVKIHYTVEEENVEGFQTQYSSNADKTVWTITNTAPGTSKTVDTVNTENQKPLLVGQKIYYNITVSNRSTEPMTDITVTEEVGNTIVKNGELYTVNEADTVAKIASIAAGGSVVVKVEHTVSQDDVKASKDINTATVNYNGKDYAVTAEQVVILPIVITSPDHSWTYDGTTHTDHDYVVTYGGEKVKVGTDGKYTLPNGDKVTVIPKGEAQVKNVEDSDEDNNTFTYEIESTDSTREYPVTEVYGDLSITPIEVKIVVPNAEKKYGEDDPDFTDGQFASGTPDFVKEDLKDLDTSVERTNNDEAVGKYDDVLTTEKSAADYNKEYPNYVFTIIPGDFTITGDPVKTEKTVFENTKTDKDGNALVGSLVTFDITVQNLSNTALSNVEVTDAKATIIEGTGYELTAGKATIATLLVGGSVVVKAQYTVTEADVVAGGYTNVATVKVGDKTFNPECDVPVEDIDPQIKVEKTSNKAGQKVAIGETITYTLTVENKGNVTLKNVTVEDAMTGFKTEIATLAVNDPQTFTTEHKVTEADVVAGEIVNKVTATSDPVPDPKDPEHPKTPYDDDEITDEPEDIDPILSVEKKSDAGLANKTVKVGEKITYTIVVKNEGNVTLKNVVVKDALINYTETIKELAAGASKIITLAYTVTKADALAGKITNVATAKADPIPDPKDPEHPKTPYDEDDVTDKTEPITHDLIVDYVYEDGKPAADTVTETHVEGDDYKVESPVIPGYKPDIKVVEGTMGDEDVHVVVTYTPEKHEVIVDYVYEDGKPAADTVTEKHEKGDDYKVESPVIPGYVPDVKVVEGTMGDEDVHVVVTYVPIKHELVVDYVYEDGKPAAETFKGQYPEGGSYAVTSPQITGYQPDVKVVEGTMGEKDVHVIVTYKPVDYRLTIHYVDVYGNPVTADHKEMLKYRDDYYVVSPTVADYTVGTPVLEGRMPAHNLELTVIYYKGPGLAMIPDFITPTGIAGGMNIGECFE